MAKENRIPQCPGLVILVVGHTASVFITETAMYFSSLTWNFIAAETKTSPQGIWRLDRLFGLSLAWNIDFLLPEGSEAFLGKRSGTFIG